MRWRWWQAGLMLFAGVVFGLSSNLTPVAFLITFVGVLAIRMVREKKVGEVLKRLRIWEILGVVGIVIGMAVAYIGGPGVSGYIDGGYATEYDYVSLGEVIRKPIESAVKLTKHVVSNGVRVVATMVVVLVVFAGMRVVRKWLRKKQDRLVWWPVEEKERRALMALVGFVVVHILVAMQLSAPLRILLPAYVAGVMAVMLLVREWTRGWGMEVVGAGMLVLVVGVVGARTVLALEYHEKAGKVLEKIRESETSVVCVTREEVTSRTLPGIYLGQEDMIADWTLPVKIYDKEVVWCE